MYLVMDRETLTPRQTKIFYAGFAVILLVMIGLIVASVYVPTRDTQTGLGLGAVVFGFIGPPMWKAYVVLYVKERNMEPHIPC